MPRGRYHDDKLPADFVVPIIGGIVICVGYFGWWIVSAVTGA